MLRGRARPAVSAAALAAALGCAALPPPESSPGELASRVARRLPELPRGAIPIPHRVSPELVERARAQVRGGRGSPERARDLVASLSDPGRFGLRYQWAATRDAVATAAAGGGNCLSLSALLVGLARELGFRARYVEVSRDLERREHDDLAVWAGHVAVALDTRDGRLLVDFRGELEPRARVRVISDLEAVAHFLNNRGFELLEAARRRGDPPPWDAARQLFERAARVEPDFAPAWNNLGVALARLGRHEEAARVYQRALAQGPDLEAPGRNLVSLETRRRSAAGGSGAAPRP